MNPLKEKLENYSVQPDEKVWSSIENTMHAHNAAMRRRRWSAAVATLLAGGAIVAVALARTAEQPDRQPLVAENISPVKVAAVGDETPVTAATATISPAAGTPVQPVTPSATTDGEAAAPSCASIVPSAPEPEPAATAQPAPTIAEQEANTAAITAPQAAQTSVQQQTPTTAAAQPAADGIQTGQQQAQPKILPQPAKAANEDLVVWIPTAFAPDDPNDDVRTFRVRPNSDANIISFEIFIYSRGGRQVYHSKDISAGWDGVSNGHAQPMGAYVYLIEINDAVKGLQHKKGTITLVR